MLSRFPPSGMGTEREHAYELWDVWPRSVISMCSDESLSLKRGEKENKEIIERQTEIYIYIFFLFTLGKTSQEYFLFVKSSQCDLEGKKKTTIK